MYVFRNMNIYVTTSNVKGEHGFERVQAMLYGRV